MTRGTENASSNVAQEFDAPIIKLTNLILLDICRKDATGSRWVEGERTLQINYIIDDVEHQVMRPPHKLLGSMLAYLRHLCGVGPEDMGGSATLSSEEFGEVVYNITFPNTKLVEGGTLVCEITAHVESEGQDLGIVLGGRRRLYTLEEVIEPERIPVVFGLATNIILRELRRQGAELILVVLGERLAFHYTIGDRMPMHNSFSAKRWEHIEKHLRESSNFDEEKGLGKIEFPETHHYHACELDVTFPDEPFEGGGQLVCEIVVNY